MGTCLSSCLSRLRPDGGLADVGDSSWLFFELRSLQIATNFFFELRTRSASKQRWLSSFPRRNYPSSPIIEASTMQWYFAAALLEVGPLCLSSVEPPTLWKLPLRSGTAAMDPDAVAKAFVEHYYTTFDANHAVLANLFQEGSTLTFEGQKIQGSQRIVAKLTSLPFQQCQHSITTVDCQPSVPDGGMLVFVSGNLKLAGEQHALKFSRCSI